MDVQDCVLIFAARIARLVAACLRSNVELIRRTLRGGSICKFTREAFQSRVFLDRYSLAELQMRYEAVQRRFEKAELARGR